MYDKLAGPEVAEKEKAEIMKAFEDFILVDDHPCIMAQAVFNSENYTLNCYNNLDSEHTAQKMVNDLEGFVYNHDFEGNEIESFVAVFPEASIHSEEEFENLLWKLLSNINKNDSHEWDETVSSNPEDKDFSFSVTGKAFFVVGMHPKSSRMARQSPFPAIAFNLHHQFEKLRKKGSFEELKHKIRKRDKALQGNINPMVEDFGNHSEAKQYSGRKVDKSWKCPFHPTKEN